MSAFSGFGPFAADLRISERGILVHRLLKAIDPVPEAAPVGSILGDPQNPKRRAEAIAHLDAMPPAAQSRVMAAYEKLCRRAA